MKKKLQTLILVVILLFSMKAHAQKKPYASFDHIALHVNDLDRSVQFYAKWFQLDSIPDPFPQLRVTWFSLGGNMQLHLIEGDTPMPSGKYHLCFSVVSISDFIARLKKEKIDYFDAAGKKGAVTERADNVRQLYFYDPDGHKLEVNDASF